MSHSGAWPSPARSLARWLLACSARWIRFLILFLPSSERCASGARRLCTYPTGKSKMGRHRQYYIQTGEQYSRGGGGRHAQAEAVYLQSYLDST